MVTIGRRCILGWCCGLGTTGVFMDMSCPHTGVHLIIHIL